MIERHRHATVGRVRRLRNADRTHAIGQTRVVRRRGGLKDLYSADNAEARGGGRFRWFFSTCLAATVGSVAIMAALFGASDPHSDGRPGGMPTFRTISTTMQLDPPPSPFTQDGLAWATPKADRLEATTGAMVTRYIVQESIRQRRGSREYIQNKPYARVLARLVAVRADSVGSIPAFNPIRLYGNTTVLEKVGGESDDAADLEGRQIRTHKVGRGDTLQRILQQAGADPRLARGMVESARGTFPDRELTAGFVVDITLEPSLANPDQLEPMRYAVYDERGKHRVSVERGAAGEFIASATPLADGGRAVTTRESQRSAAASLYAGVYHAAQSQGVDQELIQQILRLHAHETDFRRRARFTDELELFFDLREEGRGDEHLGELLYSGMTAGGETQRFFRFRTNDGVVDYYDEDGNNSRRFLNLRPLRSDEARLTSGFGVRYHPLLNVRRGHTGVDWAAPVGTPIMATGNGVIEEAGPKGQYGNYIRIRHANGYQTAYAHMHGYAPGVRAGVKVRQNQVIGYVGNTGFSTGPHIHYEVLVNNQFVDPMSIQVPRERRLTGRQLAEFHKERGRIEELLRRQPVRVEQVAGR